MRISSSCCRRPCATASRVWLTSGLLNKQLSTLAATTFNGCTRLKQLALAGNQLSMLPATIFDNLPSLTRIFLKCESYWGDSSCTTSGRDNPALTCTPLTQERIADLYYSGTSHGRDKFYKGPMVTCQYCTAGKAGPVGGTCTPCSAGKYSPNSGATACIDCEGWQVLCCCGCHCVHQLRRWEVLGFDSADELRCLHQLRRWEVLCCCRCVSACHTHTHACPHARTHARPQTQYVHACMCG